MKKIITVFLLVYFLQITGCSTRTGPDALPGLNSSPSDAISALAEREDESGDSDNAGLEVDSEKENRVEDKGLIYEIKEKMFIEQCNDIYLNPEDYKHKTIKLEGMYDEYTDTETDKTYCYIYRNGPGCCGNDGVAGFEILYEGTSPKLNDWIEAIGSVEVITDDGYEYIALRLSRLTVLDKRGAEFVAN